ncbi:MAG: hypothetical protein WC867_05945 [Candidatus Pacearchaeota archaeon]|jgi:hypothetical protein
MSHITSKYDSKGIEHKIPWTSPEDAFQMVVFYETSSNKLKGLNGDKLVENIEWRVYTEWCCNINESGSNLPKDYFGEGFNDWVNKETHFALERAGYEWVEKEGRFKTTDESVYEIYHATRDKVLKAVVRRAVEFFKDCKDYQWVQYEEPKNIRVSLEQYM